MSARRRTASMTSVNAMMQNSLLFLRRHKERPASCGCLGVWEMPTPSIEDPFYFETFRFGHFLTEKVFVESGDVTQCSQHVLVCFEQEYDDVCDGLSDEGMKVKITDRVASQRWVPRKLSEGEPLEAKYSDFKDKTLAWRVRGHKDLWVIGFQDFKSDQIFYPIVEKGPLRISSAGDDPNSLNASEAVNDPRVLRYFKSKKLGNHVLQSAKNPKLFIKIKEGNVTAEEVDESNATVWDMRPE